MGLGVISLVKYEVQKAGEKSGKREKRLFDLASSRSFQQSGGQQRKRDDCNDFQTVQNFASCSNRKCILVLLLLYEYEFTLVLFSFLSDVTML